MLDIVVAGGWELHKHGSVIIQRVFRFDLATATYGIRSLRPPEVWCALDSSAMALRWLLALLMASSGLCLEPCCRAFQNDAELREAVRRWGSRSETWQG